MVLSFFQNSFEFLKKKKNTVILKILKISEKPNCKIAQFSLKPFSLKKQVKEFYKALSRFEAYAGLLGYLFLAPPQKFLVSVEESKDLFATFII